MGAVVTPLELTIGGDNGTKVEVGQEIREALRREQIRALHEGLTAIKEAEERMPAMDDPTVRATLEELTLALRWADRACDALWYLAPEYDDGQAPE